MKVHFFLRSLNHTLGGSHLNSMTYIRMLRENGHEVTAHVVYPTGNMFPPDIEPVVHQGFGLGHLGERDYIAKLLKQYEQEADIFFLYSVEFMWGGGLYRRTGGTKPVVVYMDACLASLRVMPTKTLSAWWYQYKRLPWDKWVGLRDARAIDQFLPCSPAIEEAYVRFGFPKERFTVLPNIVPKMVVPSTTDTKDELVVLYVGRLIYIKGVDLLVEAMAQLKAYRAKLVIVGDGDMRAEIEQRARESGVAVEMVGWIAEDKLGPYYATADIFAHSTRCVDAAPRTVVNALQAGLPLVVPDTGGAAWIAREAGLVYKTKDKNGLTEALRRLLDSAELREKLASRAPSLAQRFDGSVVYPLLEQILRATIEKNQKRIGTLSKPKRPIRKMLDFLLEKRWFFVVGMIYAVVATMKTKRLVWVYYDHEDWIHRWRSGAFVHFEPALNPLRKIHTGTIALFTYDYTPKLGETIVDVGAGAGTELQAFSEMVGPTGRVIAIEADPSAYRRLEKLRNLLKLTNVTLVRSAVGDTEGTSYLIQDTPGAIENRIGTAGDASAIEVSMTTLDHLIDTLGLTHIDYLKMNIEGSEVAALKGLVTQRSVVKNWCVSCHDFLGTEEGRTFDFVHMWFADNKLSIRRHPDVPGSPWMGFYLYAHP